MKTKGGKSLSLFQKMMVIFVPIIVLLLIAAIVMCFAFNFLPMSAHDFLSTGYLTIAFSTVSSLLAIAGIFLAVFNKGKDSDGE